MKRTMFLFSRGFMKQACYHCRMARKKFLANFYTQNLPPINNHQLIQISNHWVASFLCNSMIFKYLFNTNEPITYAEMQTIHQHSSIDCKLHTELSTAWQMMLMQAVAVFHHTRVYNMPFPRPLCRWQARDPSCERTYRRIAGTVPAAFAT